MKKTLTLLFIALYLNASATTYYISSSGNDSANGLSESTPWKTISKLNSSFYIIKPGDRILFKRGDTFYGTINITKSGTSGSPIYFGAYGTGEKPVITGFTTVSSWTNNGSGIYSAPVTSECSPNVLTINDVHYPMGRYPNTGYLTYESHSTNTSITDNELSSFPNWTGGEAVIRKLNYVIDRSRINTHSGTTLSYTNLGTTIEPTDKFGYFIQNHLKTLDTFGEWYYDGSRIYLYFGTKLPSSYEVKVSSLKNIVYSSTWDYLSFDNLSFQGSASSAIYLYGADYSSIKNCIIDFSGENGIYAVGNISLTIDNCVIENSLRAGIYIQGGKNATITNNNITNSGNIPGGSNTSTQNNGVYITSNDDCLVQYNSISYSGYNGIYFTGNRVIVKNNFINYSCMLLNDGGGIYTVGSSFSGRVIEGNIVLNSTGNTEGTSRPYLYAEGIFVDSNGSDVTVKNNTTANCMRSGIFFHEAHDNICTGNTSFNNVNQIRFQSDRVISYVKNISVKENVFISKTSTQLAVWARSSYEDIPAFVVTDYNYYARPVDDDNVFYTQTPSTGVNYRTLEGWQSYIKQDANSQKSPVTVTNADDIRFEYNTTKTNRVVALDKPMIDVKGNKYSGSITLLPYTSVVLMADPNSSVVPVYKSSAVENAAPSVLEIIYDITLANIVPATSAFTVKINTVTRSLSKVAISGNKVLLTLSSPVVDSDIISVSYTRPSTNPLQSTLGGLASSLASQQVTNKVNGTAPIYQNSIIPTYPTIMVMNYSLPLADIVPTVTAFTVKVNAVPTEINSVRIYGSSVWVYLKTGVAGGDIVTVSYEKPASDPLQSKTGVLAASITDQVVINRIEPEGEPPTYLNSVIPAHPTIMVMNYSLPLANILPETSSFTVKVNSVPRNIQFIRIYGSAVWVYLETGVEAGDIVTVSYTRPATNPLQSETGIPAATINDQPVTNKIEPAGDPPVYLSSIIPTHPTIMVMNYSLPLANILPATSSFTVKVNSTPRNIQFIRIYGSAVWVYLETGVEAGDIVTVSYTRPAANPLQSEIGIPAATIYDQPVTNKIEPAGDPPVYLSSIIPTYPTIMVMNYSLPLANILPAISSFTVKVNSVPRNIQTVRIYGSAVWVYLETGVASGDVVTVAYDRPSTNPLQSESGVAAASLSAQIVTNNIMASKSANNLAATEFIYEPAASSGFVYEIGISDDFIKDIYLNQFDWIVPEGINVSSITGSGIKYLAPVVSYPENVEFSVSINDGLKKQLINIPVTIVPYRSELEQVNITRTEAENYIADNYPDNITDNNISTFWSAEGYGQWIWLELASPVSINHIQLAFLPDQKYVSYFDIYASKDNSIWEPVLVNASSCDFSGNLQVFEFPAEKSITEYSYVKIVGNGNSLNNQNHFSEIRIFGNISDKLINSSPEVLSVYPNPVRDFLNIEFSETTDKLQSLKIFDLSGKLCLTERLEPGVQTMHMPINLRPGVYFMKLVSGNMEILNQKLIVVN